MIRTKRIVMGLFFVFSLTGIIVAINIDKSRSVTANEELEIAIINSMENTQKEKDKLFTLLEIIPKALHDKGFGEYNLGFSNIDRVFTVQGKGRETIEKNKDTVESLILDIAKEYDFRNIKVEFLSLEGFMPSEEDLKNQEELSKVSNIVSDVLQENGYGRNVGTIFEDEIKIVLLNGKQTNVDEIEKQIVQDVFSKTKRRFAVTIKGLSKNQKLEQKWQPVFGAIRDEVSKKFGDYRGFAYSFHPKPLEIIVKTNLSKSKWFWDTDKTVKQIVTYTDKIIELKTTELSIEKVPYKIIIYDKKGKRMN